MKSDEERRKEYERYYNRDAKIVVNGKTYEISEDDIQNLNSTKLNYWHEKTRASTWLTTSVVELIKSKFEDELNEDQMIDLAAQILNTDPDALYYALDWNAQYMGWHESTPPEEFHPFGHLKN